MSNLNSQLEGKPIWMRLLPYTAFGILVFSLTSATDLNYFVKGYLVLLLAQSGIVAVYFLRGKLARSNQKKHD